MTTKTIFEIEQLTSHGNWEPIPNGECRDMEHARECMEDLETNLGWRNMRITSYLDGPIIENRQVVEYGS